MAYLLDSNIVIHYLANDPSVVPMVEHLTPQGTAISVITYLEAFQGTLRGPDLRQARAEFEQFVSVLPILPLSLAVAQRCAYLREFLAQRGRRVRARAFDLVIAATALEHGLILVTRNVDDFRDVPSLSLYQPD